MSPSADALMVVPHRRLSSVVWAAQRGAFHSGPFLHGRSRSDLPAVHCTWSRRNTRGASTAQGLPSKQTLPFLHRWCFRHTVIRRHAWLQHPVRLQKCRIGTHIWIRLWPPVHISSPCYSQLSDNNSALLLSLFAVLMMCVWASTSQVLLIMGTLGAQRWLPTENAFMSGRHFLSTVWRRAS